MVIGLILVAGVISTAVWLSWSSEPDAGTTGDTPPPSEDTPTDDTGGYDLEDGGDLDFGDGGGGNYGGIIIPGGGGGGGGISSVGPGSSGPSATYTPPSPPPSSSPLPPSSSPSPPSGTILEDPTPTIITPDQGMFAPQEEEPAPTITAPDGLFSRGDAAAVPEEEAPSEPKAPNYLDSFAVAESYLLNASNLQRSKKSLQECAQLCLNDDTCKSFYYADAPDRDDSCSTTTYMQGDYDTGSKSVLTLSPGSEYDYYQKVGAKVTSFKPIVTDYYNTDVTTLTRYRFKSDSYWLKDTQGPVEVTSNGDLASVMRLRLVATGESNEYYLLSDNDQYMIALNTSDVSVTATRQDRAKWKLPKYGSIYYVQNSVNGQYLGYESSRARLKPDYTAWTLIAEGDPVPEDPIVNVAPAVEETSVVEPKPVSPISMLVEEKSTVPQTSAQVENQYALEYTPPLRPVMYKQFLYAASATSIRLTGPTQRASTIVVSKTNGVNTYTIQINGDYLRCDYGTIKLTAFAPPYDQLTWTVTQSPKGDTYALSNIVPSGTYVLFLRETTKEIMTETYRYVMEYNLEAASTSTVAALDAYGVFRWVIDGITYVDPNAPPPAPTVLKPITQEKTVAELAQLAADKYGQDNADVGMTKKYDMGLVVDDDSVDISFLYYKGSTFNHIDARRYNFTRDANQKVIYYNNDGRNSGLKALPGQLTSQYTATELFDLAKAYYLNNGGSFANLTKANPLDATTVDYFFMDASKGYQLRRYVFKRNGVTGAIEVASQGVQDSAQSLIQFKPVVQQAPLFEAGQAIYVLKTLYGTYLSKTPVSDVWHNATTVLSDAYRMAFVRVNPSVSGDNQYYLVSPEGTYLRVNGLNLETTTVKDGAIWYVDVSATDPNRITAIYTSGGDHLIWGFNGSRWAVAGSTGLNASSYSKGWTSTKVGST